MIRRVFLLLALGLTFASTTANVAAHDKTVQDWVAQLNSKDVLARQDAADALAALGPRARAAAPALVAALKDWRVSRLASRALVRIGADAVPELLKAADTEDYALAQAVPKTLTKIGPAAIPDLIVAVRHGTRRVRNAAIDVLAALGPAAEPAIPALVEALQRRNVVVTLPYTGADGVDEGNNPSVLRIDDDADQSRASAATALARIGPKALPALLKAVQSSAGDFPGPIFGRPELVFRGLAHIDYVNLVRTGELRPWFRRQFAEVLRDMKDSQRTTRLLAAEALGDVAPVPLEVLAGISGALRDPDVHVRVTAARTLHHLVCWDELRHHDRAVREKIMEKIIPAIMECIKDPSYIAPPPTGLPSRESMQFYGTMALWHSGVRGKALLLAEGLPVLIASLRHRDPWVRHYALESLALLGPDARPALPEILHLLNETRAPKKPGKGASPDHDLPHGDHVLHVTVARIGTAAVPELLRMLEDSDQETRRTALLILGEMGRPARGTVAALAQALAEGDSDLRRLAGVALRDIGRPARLAIPKLQESLDDEDNRVVHAAAEALLRISPKEWQVPLRVFPRLLADETFGRSLHAAQTLRPLGPKARAVAPALAEACRADKRGEISGFVAQTLVSIDPEGAVSVLQELVDNGHKELEELLDTLRPPSKEYVLKMVDAIRAGHYSERSLEAFSKIGSLAAAAVPGLVTCLEGQACFAPAVAALGSIGPAAEKATPALIAGLRFAEGTDRAAVIEALGHIGAPRQQVLSTLMTLLDDPEDAEPAATALGSMGSAARVVVPKLEKLLAATKTKVHAADALLHIAGPRPAYIEAVVQCLDGPNAEAAAAILVRLGPAAKPALPALRRLLQEKSDGFYEVREAVAQALGNIGPDAAPAVPELLRLLDDPLFHLRRTAAEALGNIGVEKVIPRLVVLAEEDDTDVVAEVAELALSKIRLLQKRGR